MTSTKTTPPTWRTEMSKLTPREILTAGAV
ncbi:keto-hydroxyglutarate-aldolase/keto-deoxy-phosphogluconate aldolase, partial [Neisseria gonorrhoeae]